MENLVEITKQNTVLNALWYADKWGYDKNNIKLCDIFGPGTDVSGYIGQLIFGKYRLILICTGKEYSLASHFESDSDMNKFISNNMQELFSKVIKKYNEYIYILNIITVEELHDSHIRDIYEPYIQKGILLFTPIIQKFIVDSLTDNLKIEE